MDLLNKKTYPKISVVTPSYNQGEYLEDCIISVLKQGYPNVEHIIMDNCSTDKTLYILNKYSHLIWKSEKDKGQSDAINKAVGIASGEWVLWLNADDFLLPNALMQYYKIAIQMPALDLIYGHIAFVNENKELIKKVYHIKHSYSMIKYGIYAPPSTGSLFRKEKLLKNPLSLDYHYTMDTEWFLRCGQNLRSKVIDHEIVAFRVSQTNKTSQNITNGTIVPQHAKEREMYKKKYIFPICSDNLKVDSFVYWLGQKVFKLIYLFRKIKYVYRYLKIDRNLRTY